MDKERLQRIADKLTEKRNSEKPRNVEDEEEEGFEGVDVKMYDDVFEHVMHKRHKIKQINPEKIKKIEEECHHPNQTEDLHENSLNLKSIEDDFILTDLKLQEDEFMVGGKVSPAEVTVVNETQPSKHHRKSELSPRTTVGGDAALTARDIRLGSFSSENSMDDQSSLDSVSLASSGSSRGNGSPMGGRLCKSENLDPFSHRSSRTSLRAFSVSEMDEKHYNQDKNSSRQEILKQMRLSTKKLRKERKEEIRVIEKQKAKRREIAVKAKQETLREEVLKGTYSERLANSLDAIMHKFELDNKDDILTLKSAMELLSTEESNA